MTKKIISKKKIKKINTKSIFGKNLIKIFLIFFIIGGFYYTQSSYSNSISLLAVSENNNNSIQEGSIVNLYLKIKPGSGNIYVNLNTIEEVDTQISIINSQKITCKLFNLDCENYDFFYDFSGSALILKGPSASSAISILTAKTFLHEKINPKIVITGSLNSGGIIGVVGGIKEKIKIAQKLGFEKVLIPKFSIINSSLNFKKIKIVKVIDIIDAYNNFDSNKFELRTYSIKKENYLNVMKILGNDICKRTVQIKSQINFSEIKINSSEKEYFNLAKKTFNSSINAKKNGNYYSQGSFCFNSNINYRIVLEKEKNYSIKSINEKIKKLEKNINLNYGEIISTNYKKKIITTNDFYVYLILNDRVEESKKIILENNNYKSNKIQFLINQTNISINLSQKNIFDKNLLNKKILIYSSALERLYTVKIWEKFITHSGNKINFDKQKITNACFKINKEINIKEQILKNYKIDIFKEQIDISNKLTQFGQNKYYCLYQGFQTIGNMNSVLNSVGISSKNLKNFTIEFTNFTMSRLSINSNGNFPLIPFIYYEYSKDLLGYNDYITSLLYSNYALVYSDLNLYLQEDKISQRYSNVILNDLFSNLIFLFAILILVAFV